MAGSRGGGVLRPQPPRVERGAARGHRRVAVSGRSLATALPGDRGLVGRSGHRGDRAAAAALRGPYGPDPDAPRLPPARSPRGPGTHGAAAIGAPPRRSGAWAHAPDRLPG